jgi:hypothetical protein
MFQFEWADAARWAQEERGPASFSSAVAPRDVMSRFASLGRALPHSIGRATRFGECRTELGATTRPGSSPDPSP